MSSQQLCYRCLRPARRSLQLIRELLDGVLFEGLLSELPLRCWHGLDRSVRDCPAAACQLGRTAGDTGDELLAWVSPGSRCRNENHRLRESTHSYPSAPARSRRAHRGAPSSVLRRNVSRSTGTSHPVTQWKELRSSRGRFRGNAGGNYDLRLEFRRPGGARRRRIQQHRIVRSTQRCGPAAPLTLASPSNVCFSDPS